MVCFDQAKVKNVGVGDHIQAINGTDLTGCRHFEVARMLKEIPIGSQFTLTTVEPRKAFEAIAPRSAAPSQNTIAAGAGKKTLRMKAGASATVEDEVHGRSTCRCLSVTYVVLCSPQQR
jgi:hypothetical protein